MTVSVIIPCYNSEAFIAEAVESARAQRPLVSEIIVVNDGSTDMSADVVRRYPDVTLIDQANEGVSFARNAGARAASGLFLLFLDADDRLKPGAVAAHLQAFAADARRVLVFGVCDIIDEDGSFIKPYRQAAGPCTYWDILLGITPNPSQCMLRKAEFDQIGGFDSRLAFGEDWECFMRMSRTGDAYCHGQVVADYRKHGTQATRRPSAILSSMVQIIKDHEAAYGTGAQDRGRFREAERHYVRLFGKWIPGEAARYVVRGSFRAGARSAGIFIRHFPQSGRDLMSYLASTLHGKLRLS